MYLVKNRAKSPCLSLYGSIYIAGLLLVSIVGCYISVCMYCFFLFWFGLVLCMFCFSSP